MKNKFRNIIVSFILTLLCGVATTSGVLVNKNNEKEVKAEENSTTQRIYLNALAAYNNSSNHWDNNARTLVYFSDSTYKECTWKSRCIWYVDVETTKISASSSVTFKRVKSSDTSNVFNYSTTYSYTNGNLDKNLCILTGWTNESYWCSPSDFYVKGKISEKNLKWNDDGISMTASYKDSDPYYELCASGVSLTENDEFKIYIKTGNTFFAYGQIELQSDLSSYLSCANENANITVSKDITVDIYFKPLCNEGYENNNLDHKKIYIQENSTVAASKFADNFISATSTICSTDGQAADHSSALSDIWSTWSTNFSNLTVGAKSEFNESEKQNIPNARNRYIHIVTRYTTLTLWTDGPTVTRSASGANRNVNLLSKNSAALLSTTIIALVALSSFGAYALTKKKKVRQ